MARAPPSIRQPKPQPIASRQGAPWLGRTDCPRFLPSTRAHTAGSRPGLPIPLPVRMVSVSVFFQGKLFTGRGSANRNTDAPACDFRWGQERVELRPQDGQPPFFSGAGGLIPASSPRALRARARRRWNPRADQPNGCRKDRLPSRSKTPTRPYLAERSLAPPASRASHRCQTMPLFGRHPQPRLVRENRELAHAIALSTSLGMALHGFLLVNAWHTMKRSRHAGRPRYRPSSHSDPPPPR
ncbi:hypothetical protein MPNT_80075 [Candidatus Methylacidithermus pantelleriae]|uniref:Uncharacterized protein n=1 Tax=Candidatus Methylacidithermus pantelleriae TaxID=2744239 RepID=A0A8J2BSW7_9BACT|nr:hypothetical protein MPNT_80075 [Candidatus Methylacidithermus pantelleriae]